MASNATAQVAAGAATAPPPAAPAAAPRATEAVARVTVIEDDGVRIEETRLRGAAQRITVQSKVGNAREYEIIVGRGGRDPSQDRGAAGQRAWSVLGF
ncbi:MAG: hypothetical protein KF683_14095 [Rubrivivax sp.]|nr:hypothetical protein [Rubrivivax sp.]